MRTPLTSLGRALVSVVGWLRLKHTTVAQAVSTVIGAGQVLGWWHLGVDQLGAVMALVGVLWLLIGAQTTTANVRLTGRHLAGPTGVTVHDVATAHQLVQLPGTDPTKQVD
jgi:hypothetical protein